MILGFIKKWLWAIVLVAFVAWTIACVRYGYDKCRSEENKIQAKVDVANQKNKTLATELIKSNDRLFQMKHDIQKEIDAWRLKHKDVKPQPASKCVGEDDYLGAKSADKRELRSIERGKAMKVYE